MGIDLFPFNAQQCSVFLYVSFWQLLGQKVCRGQLYRYYQFYNVVDQIYALARRLCVFLLFHILAKIWYCLLFLFQQFQCIHVVVSDSGFIDCVDIHFVTRLFMLFVTFILCSIIFFLIDLQDFFRNSIYHSFTGPKLYEYLFSLFALPLNFLNDTI